MFSTRKFFLPIPKLQCHKQIKNTLKLKLIKIKFHHSCNAHKIALLPGDGIGPEISEVAVSLLKEAAKIKGFHHKYIYKLIHIISKVKNLTFKRLNLVDKPLINTIHHFLIKLKKYVKLVMPFY